MTNPDSRTTRLFDIGIVGGGPAGLSAAIWSARYGRSVVLVDSGDPRNWETRAINGYLGLPGVRPAALRGGGREQLKTYSATLIDGIVSRVTRDADVSVDDPVFRFAIDGHPTVRARRVLLAIGICDVWPDIPGLSQVYGANAHVCPDCDGYEARGKRVAVIGHGRRAVAMALELTTWTASITIVTNGHAADIDDDALRQKLAGCDISVLTEKIETLRHDGDILTALQFVGGASLDIDKLFFTIAQLPADDIGVVLGCARDRGGHLTVNDWGATSVRGVYAAGDITPGPQLAVRAAAAGAVAAMGMHRSLVPDARTLQVERRAEPGAR